MAKELGITEMQPAPFAVKMADQRRVQPPIGNHLTGRDQHRRMQIPRDICGAQDGEDSWSLQDAVSRKTMAETWQDQTKLANR